MKHFACMPSYQDQRLSVCRCQNNWTKAFIFLTLKKWLMEPSTTLPKVCEHPNTASVHYHCTWLQHWCAIRSTFLFIPSVFLNCVCKPLQLLCCWCLYLILENAWISNNYFKKPFFIQLFNLFLEVSNVHHFYFWSVRLPFMGLNQVPEQNAKVF